MEEIKKLIGCGDEWVATKARLVLELQDSHSRGDLTSEELKELLQDIANTDDLSSQACDLEMKSMLVAAIYGITSVL